MKFSEKKRICIYLVICFENYVYVLYTYLNKKHILYDRFKLQLRAFLFILTYIEIAKKITVPILSLLMLYIVLSMVKMNGYTIWFPRYLIILTHACRYENINKCMRITFFFRISWAMMVLNIFNCLSMFKRIYCN